MKITTGFLLNTLVLILCSSTVLSSPYPAKRATLLEVYRDAVLYNSDIEAAKADYQAKQEATPQAVEGLLPQINAGGSLESSRVNIKRRYPQKRRSCHHLRGEKPRTLSWLPHLYARAATTA